MNYLFKIYLYYCSSQFYNLEYIHICVMMIKCIHMYTQVVNILQIIYIYIYNINNLYIFENHTFNNFEIYFTIKNKQCKMCTHNIMCTHITVM